MTTLHIIECALISILAGLTVWACMETQRVKRRERERRRSLRRYMRYSWDDREHR